MPLPAVDFDIAVTFNLGDYGPGVTEIHTGNISVNGTALTVTGRDFTGTNGQHIAIQGAGAGGAYHKTTIASASGSSVTLTDAAPTTITNQSKTIIWGVDAKDAFNNARLDILDWIANNPGVTSAANRIELLCPSPGANKGYSFIQGSGLLNQWTKGIPHFYVHTDDDENPGNCFIGDFQGTGSGFFLGAGGTSGLFIGPSIANGGSGTYDQGWGDNATVAVDLLPGVTTIPLTPGYDDHFGANMWAMMTGIDLQGPGGAPANNHNLEYVYVTDLTDDVATIQETLDLPYKMTWPVYTRGSGSETDCGGRGVLRFLRPEWDIDHTYRGFTLRQDAATNSGGRNVRFEYLGDMPISQASVSTGPNPSVQKELTVLGTAGPNVQVEIDKLCGTVTYDGGGVRREWRNIHVQSSSVKEVVLRRLNVTLSVHGTARSQTIDDCEIEALYVGAQGYGASTDLVVTDSIIHSIQPASSSTTHIVNHVTTIDDGVITYPAGDNDGICQAQTRASAGNLVLNGAWVSAGAATSPEGTCFQVRIQPSVNVTGITFTVTGENYAGDPLALQVAGNGLHVLHTPDQQLDLFRKVTQVHVSGALGGNVSVGTTDLAPPAWAVPGGFAFLSADFTNQLSFRVTDLSKTGGAINVLTTIDSGNEWPAIPTNGGDGIIGVRAHPCPRVSFTNVTGCPEARSLSEAPNGRAFRSWQRFYFSGQPVDDETCTLRTDFWNPQTEPQGPDQNRIPVQGNLRSIRIVVTAPYTGSGALTFDIDQFVQLSAAPYTVLRPVTRINLKQAGERLLAPGAITGLQSGDWVRENGNPDAPLTAMGDIRLFDDQFHFVASADVIGELGAGPTGYIEIITDQGTGRTFSCNFV